MRPPGRPLVVAALCLTSLVACDSGRGDLSGSGGGANPTGGATGTATGGSPSSSTGGAPSTSTGGTSSGTGGAAGGSAGAGAASGGTTTGGAAAGGAAPGTGGKGGALGGQAGTTATGGQAGGTGAGGALVSGCVGGKAWPTANPAAAGPFEVAADKGVGPLAGYTPDPIYGDQQQRFNVYRPKNLANSGYCHPILVWANGHTDNPEPNPPLCVVDAGANKWCGQYAPMVNHLASHGFVVMASLSSIPSQGTPVPVVTGAAWIAAQNEDPSSEFYHHLDTSHIGASGHSEGGLATCKASSDSHITAIATVSGSAANAGLHGPALLFCGGKDTVVPCSNVMSTFSSIKDQPAMLAENLSADHGSWLYQSGVKGPDIFGITAWMRVHLMGDTANRKYFYGPSCTFCSDTRLQVTRNSFLEQP